MSFIPLFEPQGLNIYSKTAKRDSPEHVKLTNRLRKTLYYGKTPTTDRPSLPLTNIAVEFFQDASPREFGRVDTDYASFVSRRSCMSPCSMMLGMIYIERLKHKNPEYLQTISSSDLFLVSLMVASKYLYDEGIDEEVFNDEWAESAKMENEDLNHLERNFLGAIDWNLFVRPEDFTNVLNKVEKRIALTQAVDRGWFSYTDLLVLTEDLNYLNDMYNLARELSKMVMVCAVAYTASLLTLVGSTVIVSCLQTHLASLSVGSGDITASPEISRTDILYKSEPRPAAPLVVTVEGADVLIGPETVDGNTDTGVKDYISGLQIVIMMKDSMTDFFAALLSDSDLPDDYGPTKHDQQKTRHRTSYCKRGLCQYETGLNCRNVTLGSWKSGLDNLLGMFSRNGLHRRQCQSSPWVDDVDDVGARYGSRKRLGVSQRCCCDVPSKPVTRRGPDKSPIQNVMVGFRTGVPVF